MAEKVRWGILAAGKIGRKFVRGVKESRTGALGAVGSRSKERAEAFAQEHGVPRAHGSYDDLLADPEVDAIYIATPHPMHAEWAIKAVEAGKHVLCEKPLTMNYSEARKVAEAARASDRFFMEAFMYRSTPQTAKLVELIRNGAIGDVLAIDAKFAFTTDLDPSGRLLNPELGGGAILDVGCYPVSFARLIAGAAVGQAYAQPEEVKGVAQLGETGVDEYAALVMKFPQGIIAQAFTSIKIQSDNQAIISGTTGRIIVTRPWSADGKLIIRPNEGEDEEIDTTPERYSWSYQIDVVGDHLQDREGPFPCMSLADSLGNMQVLDEWRRQVDLTYPADALASET